MAVLLNGLPSWLQVNVTFSAKGISKLSRSSLSTTKPSAELSVTGKKESKFTLVSRKEKINKIHTGNTSGGSTFRNSAVPFSTGSTQQRSFV